MRILIDNGNTPTATRPYIGSGRLRQSRRNAHAASHLRQGRCRGRGGTVQGRLSATARNARIDLIMPQLARSAGATEALKATDPMKWVGLMNACRAQAEEIAKFELIYV